LLKQALKHHKKVNSLHRNRNKKLTRKSHKRNLYQDQSM